MYAINESEGYKCIEIKFNTEDGEEWYLCTGEHTTVYDALNEMIRMELSGLHTRQDRVRFAEHVHEIKKYLKIPSPGPLPRLYHQVQWKEGQYSDSVGYLALGPNGQIHNSLLIVRVFNDGTVKVHDADGLIHGIFNYPGATLYEKFLNIPTIFPNVE